MPSDQKLVWYRQFNRRSGHTIRSD